MLDIQLLFRLFPYHSEHCLSYNKTVYAQRNIEARSRIIDTVEKR
jgi:hypothetical protein